MKELKILLDKLTEVFEGQMKGQSKEDFFKSPNFSRYRKSFMLIPEKHAESLSPEVLPEIKYMLYSKAVHAPNKLPEIIDHDLDSTKMHKTTYNAAPDAFKIPEVIRTRPKTFTHNGRTYQRMIMVPSESMPNIDLSERGDFIPVKANLRSIHNDIKVPEIVKKDLRKHISMRQDYKQAVKANPIKNTKQKVVKQAQPIQAAIQEPNIEAPTEYHDRYPHIRRVESDPGSNHHLVAAIHAPKGEEPDGENHPITMYKKDNETGHVTFFSAKYPSYHSIFGRNIPTKDGLDTELELHWPDGRKPVKVNKNTPNAQAIIQQHAWEAHPGKSNNYAFNDQNFSNFNTDSYSWDLPISHPLAAFGEKI